MRKRQMSISANKLRRNYKTFENYVSQEKFKASNESAVFSNQEDYPILNRKASIISSCKRLDTVIPVRPRHKQALQRASISKLYNGSIDHFTNSLSNKSLIKTPDNGKDKTFEFSDKQDYLRYIFGLETCAALETELEMNYEVSRTSKLPAEMSLGLYYQLEEELKAISRTNWQSATSFNALQSLSKFTSFLREIIRILRYKSMDDEAMTLEFLWRGTIKIVDVTITAHQKQLEQVIENHRLELNKIVESHNKNIQRQQSIIEEDEKILKEKILELKNKIVKIKTEKREVQVRLNEKEGILQELNDVDKIELLKDTSKMLLNLSEFLEEVTEEKIIQCHLLSEIIKPELPR